MVEALPNIPIAEDSLIVKACCFIEAVIQQQSVSVPLHIMRPVLRWMLKFVAAHQSVGICDILRAVQALVRGSAEPIQEVETILNNFSRLYLCE